MSARFREDAGWQEWLALGVMASAILLFGGLMLGHRLPPFLGDYTEWTYHGVLLRDVLQGHPDPGYVLKHYPVPNSLTTVGLGLLMCVMPWMLAAKLWLFLGACTGLGCALMLQTVAGRAGFRSHGWRVPVVGATAILGGPFWFGFANFVWGVALAMLFCSLLLRGWMSRWAYAALFLLLFFTHMIPFGFALAVLGLYAVQTRRWNVLWQVVPALLLTAWYLLARATNGDADGRAGMSGSVPYGSALFAVFKLNTYLKSWGYVNPSFSGMDSLLLASVGPRFTLLLFTLNAVVAAGVLVLLVRTGWRGIRSGAPDRFFWRAVTVFVVVALVMPGAAAGISDPGGRMMQVAVWCGVCVVATRRRWTGYVLGACAVVLLGANLYLLNVVAMRPWHFGERASFLPARFLQFGRVGYADRGNYFDNLDRGEMNLPIYPTALFLKSGQARGN